MWKRLKKLLKIIRNKKCTPYFPPIARGRFGTFGKRIT